MVESIATNYDTRPTYICMGMHDQQPDLILCCVLLTYSETYLLLAGMLTSMLAIVTILMHSILQAINKYLSIEGIKPSVV